MVWPRYGANCLIPFAFVLIIRFGVDNRWLVPFGCFHVVFNGVPLELVGWFR